MLNISICTVVVAILLSGKFHSNPTFLYAFKTKYRHLSDKKTLMQNIKLAKAVIHQIHVNILID